jgi:hypothetical protein
MSDWGANGLSPFVRDTLAPSRLKTTGLLDPAEAHRVVYPTSPSSGRASAQLSTLLSLQLWAESLSRDRAVAS